jgi:hypothetical protein
VKRLRRASTEVPASTLQCGVVVVLDTETLVLGPLGTTTVTACMQQAVGWHGVDPLISTSARMGKMGDLLAELMPHPFVTVALPRISLACGR